MISELYLKAVTEKKKRQVKKILRQLLTSFRRGKGTVRSAFSRSQELQHAEEIGVGIRLVAGNEIHNPSMP